MISKKAAASLCALMFVVTACGGPDHPPHGGPKPPPGNGKQATVVAPPPASIHLAARDKSGKMFDVHVKCGSVTSLKQCAQVTESIMQKAASMKGHSRAHPQGGPASQQSSGPQSGHAPSPGNSNPAQ